MSLPVHLPPRLRQQLFPAANRLLSYFRFMWYTCGDVTPIGGNSENFSILVPKCAQNPRQSNDSELGLR